MYVSELIFVTCYFTMFYHIFTFVWQNEGVSVYVYVSALWAIRQFVYKYSKAKVHKEMFVKDRKSKIAIHMK